MASKSTNTAKNIFGAFGCIRRFGLYFFLFLSSKRCADSPDDHAEHHHQRDENPNYFDDCFAFHWYYVLCIKYNVGS
jgi:hypothetical protein